MWYDWIELTLHWFVEKSLTFYFDNKLLYLAQKKNHWKASLLTVHNLAGRVAQIVFALHRFMHSSMCACFFVVPFNFSFLLFLLVYKLSNVYIIKVYVFK